jgi:uncharacterized PurR-regulated membrane protein YhhQ (DUF165 family)
MTTAPPNPGERVAETAMRLLNPFVAAALIAYIGTIVIANWLIERYGFVSVGFGLVAPAGVYAAGLAFSARDLVHEWAGRRVVIAAIVIGAAVSWMVSPTFAVASGVAFLVSEVADLAVYEPLRARQRYSAVVLSNTVGAVVDSLIFLRLAFGSTAFWEGQVIGKLWTIIPAIVCLWIWRHRVSQRGGAPALAG